MAQIETQSLAGKTVVVTGGTTGIGRAAAKLLVAAGAKVLIFGRDAQALEEALTELKGAVQNGGAIYGLNADQSRFEDIKHVFQEADARLGSLDILINNAAISAQSILDTEPAEWEYVIKTNILGYMACCREAIDRMKPKGVGHIINVGSLSAKGRDAGNDIYVATKSGIEGFTDSLSKQVNEQGIRVTTIEPGLAGTDMTLSKVPAEQQPQQEAEQKMLTAEDLAQSIIYVLSQPQRCDIALMQIRPTKQAI